MAVCVSVYNIIQRVLSYAVVIKPDNREIFGSDP